MKRIVAVMLAVMLVASIGLFSVSAAGEKLTLDATGASATGFTFTVYRVATLADLDTGEYTIEATDTNVKAAMATPNQSGADFLAVLDAADASKVGALVGTLNGGSSMDITAPGIYYVKVTGTPNTVTKKSNSVIVWPEYADNKYTMSNMTVKLYEKVNSGTDNVTKYFTDAKAADSKTLGQGDVVSFTLEADVVGSATEQLSKYVIWDKMSKGLTYNGDLAVYYDDSTTASTSDFTIAVADNNENDVYYGGGKYITVTAKAATLSGSDFYSHSKVRVVYTATVNNSATTGTKYNPNKDGLTYNTGSGSDIEKAGREVKVYTYILEIKKTNGDGANAPVLPGATFKLYKSQADIDVTTADKSIATGTSGDNGIVKFYVAGDTNEIRLAPGTYYVKETSAPNGYALNSTVYPVTITNADLTPAISVPNYPTKLPETGGMGTMMFTVIGGCLVLAAGVMFVIIMKKKSSSK